MSDLRDTLRGIVGAAHVLTGDDMAGYATDWRRSVTGRPLAVVRPASTEEVAAVVRACAAAGAGIVPQGGNTGLAQGATPDDSGDQVVVSLTRVARIRTLDPLGQVIEVEAGVVLQTLREAAQAAGRDLPVSFAAEGSATLGGIIATNAGGLDVLRHGMTRDHVLGLEVVLADGSVVSGLRRLRKDNAGADWKHLFIGAEGALGIVTAAVLRLSPRPRDRVVALLAPRDLPAALEVFGQATDRMGETLTAFELISPRSAELVARHAGLTTPVETEGWLLLVEASSSLSGLRDAAMELLEALFEAGSVTDGVVAESEAQAADLWALRERVTESEAAEGPSLKHDVSVPIRDIPEVLEAIGAALARVAPGAVPNVFGHLGDGNLHVNVGLAPGAEAAAIQRAVHDAVAAAGGSISAEHGLGAYRLAEWQRLASPEEVALARRIKTALDPANRMNPGKALPAPEAGRR
ncbi:FAD-binding oxidoreductase [Roseivivax sp. CAU 1761]